MSLKLEDYATGDATLAIDPGKRAGYSVWHKGALTEFGHLAGDTAEHPAQLIDLWEPVKLVVEDFYVDFKRQRSRGWKTMAYRALLWRALAEARDIPVQVVTSMAWQAWAKVRRGDKAAIELVAAAFTGGGAAPGPDEADAILIGAYATTGGSET